MSYRASTSRRTWLLVPGTAVAMFAIASIVMPVGRDQVGPVPPACGIAPALAQFAQDLHDGFWSRRSASRGMFGERLQAFVEPETEGLRYCLMGQPREAIAAFQATGLRDENDRQGLYDLLDRLVVDGQYDLAEWYVREADILLGGGGLRNNLAWHYTQVEIRPETALALALSSVTAEREPYNVDTLAWAYYRNGDVRHAIESAHSAIGMEQPGRHGLGAWQDEESRESSRRLLRLIEQERASVVPSPKDPFAAR